LEQWENEMSKHTPGPWSVSSRDHVYYVTSDDEMDVCRVYGANEFSNAEQTANAEADAAMIAAAPDMLAALRALVNGAFATALASSAVEQARAAIAKAEGVS
jgi:cytochrome P450